MLPAQRSLSALKILLSAGALAAAGATFAAGGTLANTSPSGKLGDGAAGWPAGWEATALGELVSTARELNPNGRGIYYGPAPVDSQFGPDAGHQPMYLVSPPRVEGYRMAFVNRSPVLPLNVEVDGEKGPAYGAVYDVRFSPDGSHWAYVATDRWDWKREQYFSSERKVVGSDSLDGQWWVVVDGKPGPVQPCVVPGTLRFSPDGKRVAYAVQKGEREFAVVLDGEAGPVVEEIVPGGFQFSADSRRFGYVARQGKVWQVFIDGKKADREDARAFAMFFSPDGARVAYMTTERGNYTLILDGAAHPSFTSYGDVRFTEDGKHVTYVGVKGSRKAAVWDGRVGPEADEILSPGIVFNADATRLVYVRRLGQNWQVVEGGKPSPDYAGVGYGARLLPARGQEERFFISPHLHGPGVRFSPDGKHLAYAARRGTRSFIVLDGVPQTEHLGAIDPVFSADGKLAYIAQERDGQCVVVDGKPGPKFEHIHHDTLTFSPDGKQVAYQIQQGGKVNVCVGGALGVPADEILAGPAWRPDGRAEYVLKNKGGVAEFTRVVVTPASADTALPTRR